MKLKNLKFKNLIRNLELEDLAGFFIIPFYAAVCGCLAVLSAAAIWAGFKFVMFIPFGPPVFFTIFAVIIVCYVIGFFAERLDIY